MKNQVFQKKKNKDGSDYIDPKTNDFVMEVVFEEEVEISLEQKINDIDLNTQKLISNGFVFDGENFSLSVNAQINWKDYADLPEKFFPIKISTLSDTVYLLRYNKVKLFYEKAMETKINILKVGAELKDSIKKVKE